MAQKSIDEYLSEIKSGQSNDKIWVEISNALSQLSSRVDVLEHEVENLKNKLRTRV